MNNNGFSKKIISFVGFSGSGKTTFIKKLIVVLKNKGYSVGIIKHDAHRIQMDREGKDTYQFYEAGCDSVAITSTEKSVIIQRESSCPDVYQMIDKMPKETDIIIIEGYRDSDLPKIGVVRKETKKGLSLPLSNLNAVISDEKIEGVKCFTHEDISEVADFIINGDYLK